MKNTSCQIKDGPRKLQFELLQKATNYFSEERKLGCGTFGQVYKGVLEDGEEIAVKILEFKPQIDSQHFENEFGHLKRLRHENIVRLLGFCDESEPIIAQYGGRQIHCEVIHRALCLEYMPNGSLTKLLSEEYTWMNWSIRYRIIKGICEGLKYLHEGLEVPILHLDLKPDNILLDQGMVPKIADFGLSRLFGEENTIRTMPPLGTLGYWPPEFIDRGIISNKYDIFSLGVIIMKIIVGLEGYSSIANTDTRGCFDYVYNNQRPNYAFVEADYEGVRCCIEIAINCMDKDRRKRPRISDVVSKLDDLEFFSRLQQHPAVKEAEGSTVAIHSQDEWNNQVDADSNRMKNTSCQIKDGPRKLQFELLQKATNYFSEERKLGCGTFGQVYKGVLEDGEEIAVKILEFKPQIDSQHFENEFGHLKRLRHENIVRLLGFCDESEPIIAQYGGKQVHCVVIHRALCLEYMPNGSLTKLLSEEYTGTNWSTRYRIIKGICEGLKYLHELEDPILHLDLKPDNILLDQGMVPKIADFGLSRLLGEENTIRTISPLGTLGYLPPEFIDRGIISNKYDIFSLGVIIMKIIVGLEGYKSIADTDARECIDYVYNNQRPNYAFVEADYEGVRCCIEIAINCMDKDRRKRPIISDVVSKLVKEAEGSTVAIHSQDEWNNQVDADKLVVIDFPATWCSMSRGMAPVFADTAKKFTNESVLSESDQFYPASQAIRKILEISFGDLPLPVKSCLLYLTAFSGNYMIKKDRLIRRWVAEGLIPERHGKSSLETGERYFVELINRRLIQPAFDDDNDQPTGCTVHGDVANFMASLSNEENFIAPGAELNSGLFRQVSLDINYGYEHEGDTFFSDTCCHLEQKSWVVSCSDENSSGGINEAIYLHLYRVQSIACWAFKHVRVLDLEDTKGLENKQLESLGRLSLLRYLGLSRTDVTRLPPEIMALKQLTTLNLRQTRVRRLPRFGDMKLVSLLADELIILGGMGGMQELEELSEVLLGPDGSLAGNVARLVTKLGRLRMLGVRFSHLLGQNETDRQGVKHFVEEVGKSNLQSLFLDNYHHQLLDLLSASSWAHNRPHHLRKFELRMRGCPPLVPPEIASLKALTHLHIHVEAVEAEALRTLGYLPNLVLLKLRLSTSTGLAVGSKDGFHCLKVFSYHGALGLQFEEGAMPQLRRLCLDLDAREEMPEFESLEFGIQHLTCLVQVRATIHCNDTLAASEVEAAEAHIRGQVSLNPNNRVLELNTRVQRSGAKAAEAPVIAIQSPDEWNSQVRPDKLVVVFFAATWCIPSCRIAPFFADLAKKIPNVVFLKVDIDDDEMSIISGQYGVNALPTFLFMRGDTVKDRLRGAYVEELEEKLLELSLML